jgi:rod shape determining protein RodA
MMRSNSPLGRWAGMDWFLLLTFVVVAICGIAIQISVGYSASNAQGQAILDPTFAVSHGTRFLVALVIGLVLAALPLGLWASLAYPVYLVGVVMLLGVELVGVTINGAQRWLVVGPIQLQPSELLKIALPLALARYYHQMFAAGRTGLWTHMPALMMTLIPTAFVMHQPDLGTALMILGTGLAVTFFAGLSLKLIVAAAAMLAAFAPVAYFFILHDYQRARIDTLFNPEADPLGAGYQLKQGLIAIGSGGFAGRGFLEGQQKTLDYIPEQQTDFIFTVIAEEFGFAGSIVILGIFFVLLVQGMMIAGRAGSVFGALAASGFVATMAIYVIINIGMVIGLLPVVGIPLPLISYGGTVMLTVMAGFGLLMAVHLNRDSSVPIRGLF